jgi:hypothetical protein
MWKAIIIVCALGNPCVIMEEDPMKYYQNYNDCMKVAQKKHERVLESFSVYGYQIDSSEFKCLKDNLQGT